MKVILITCLMVLSFAVQAQFDPFTQPLVYQSPEMSKVLVESGKVYKTLHADTILKFDIYYPPGFKKDKNLPVVIFNNGVGGNQVPEWRIYKDWAKLVATHGMIGIAHQSRQGKTLKDTEDLIAYLRSSTALNIDKDNLAIWACSANTPTGWGVANNPKNDFIKAVAIYYGFVNPPQQKVNRTDLEILLVRAGLDSHNLNSSMENLMIHALRVDAHVEYINYPEGQHAFDGVDNTPRTKEIILQTIDFFKRNLLGDNSEPKSPLITNRQFWNAVITDNQTDDAIQKYKAAFQVYDSKPVKFPFWNAIINENNLTGIGYQLLQNNRTDDALKIFTMGIELFPQSANAHDALSDVYEKKADKENTLKYARLALEKLEKATNIQPQFAQAIRSSAQGKINAIENPPSTNVPPLRAHHELVYDESTQSVLMTGGSTPLNGGSSFQFFNDVWQYKNSKWTKLGNAGDERSGFRMVYDTKRKKIFSIGGFTGESRSEFRVFDDNEWKVLTAIPEMKVAEPGFVYDEARDRLIMFGGGGGRGQLNGTHWEWDGLLWKKFNGTVPDARQAFVMVYDSKRKRTIVYGGMGASPDKKFDDVWEFDGTAWKKISDSGPGARMSPGCAYDSKRGMMILFGGMTDGKSRNDTWGWDGKQWKKLAETGPPARAMGYLAYDKSRDRVVMFGGRLGWPNDANDTWEWDGTKWTEVKIVP